MPTRIGLHSGDIALGNVGSKDHLEFRAVGDTVNTAARIESMGKQLGVNLLASDEVVRSQDLALTRDLGLFLVVGRRQALRIHELLGSRRDLGDAMRWLLDAFAVALADFQQRRWVRASEGFGSILRRKPADGPSRFFLALSGQYRSDPPPEDWGGVVVLTKK